MRKEGPKENSIRRMASNINGLINPETKTENSKDTLRRLWTYLGRKNTKLFLVFILVVLSTLLGLAGPYLIGLAIDSIKLGQASINFTRLRNLIFLMTATYLLSTFLTWLQMYIMIDISQKTIRNIRRDIFEKLQSLPLSFFELKTHGELMSRLTNDVENINHSLTQSTIQLFTSIITILGVAVIIFIINPILALLSLITIPIGIIITKIISNRTRNYFSEQQTELGNLNGHIEENITGLKVIKAFAQEEKSIEKFNEINIRLRKSSVRAQIYSGIILPLVNISNNLSFAIVAIVGGVMGARGVITIGTIAMFLSYSRIFTRPITEIANQYNMVQSAIAGAERVFEIIDETSEKDLKEGLVELDKVNGEIIFKNVNFAYKDEEIVLENINFIVKPGQKIALVGETGAGKTTIVNLLMRFYDLHSGEILIDGCNINKITRKNLRNNISMVLQDNYLFAGTIMENIRYGKLDATDEEVRKAAKLANAHLFILKLTEGYDTLVTEGGNSLSQGERQLLSIARAILAKASILILDEATSSVDTRTEIKIQQAMNTLMRDKTSLIIAHRLSTIKDADQILIINDGKIAEKGTHQQLLQQKGLYYSLYYSQISNRVS
ncbi:ABC transporter ATP-binding protein [Serpentinicella alkaliphila]|uniref:ATP-binding cassette subfamily B protein n=1 Tax=Serpentinicella alkaliphila TaxID=1734049 RepID=A0A4R2T959_9FIRM|nr:ABC transporter ATP-binding protein [Serpentinicella alkaliphila]QUH25770.1 ABC transporter ATP-binding protein [Serpentinicella alkaliphila]TCP99769.1 ATP-binding cassette subfamily B protein [Serpentinicella alkaliphila]